jgi:hypothetical protein
VAIAEHDLDGYVLLELNGPNVSPATVDVPSFLDLAASFFQLVKANSDEMAADLRLTGIEIIDKCAAVRARPDAVDVAKECAELALRQIGGDAAPRGAAQHVERARAAVRALPADHCAKVLIGPWRRSIVVRPDDAIAPLDEVLAIRAEPIRAGGKRPAVRFRSFLEEDFTLEVTAEQARALGAILYSEVEIEARISRDAEGYIDGGRLLSFEPIDEGDPRPAWLEWFKRVQGEGHGSGH